MSATDCGRLPREDFWELDVVNVEEHEPFIVWKRAGRAQSLGLAAQAGIARFLLDHA